MYSAQVSSKGQVVIPKELRDRWGISEGSVVAFTEDGHGLHLTVQRQAQQAEILQSLQEGAGLLRYIGPALSPAEMRDGIRKAFKKQAR